MDGPRAVDDGQIDPIRERALAMANSSSLTDERVVERAAIFESYLRGETGSKENPLPFGDGPDDQPDALHG